MRRLAVAVLCLSGLSVGGAEEMTVVEQALPPTLESGSEYSVRLVVANDGDLPWAPEEGFAISYHWLDANGEPVLWDGRRSTLGETVHPGAVVELEAVVEAPRRPGQYLLRWDVVQEGVRWISEIDSSPPDPVPVTVVAGHAFEVLTASVPRLMVAGSTTLAELVLRNAGTRMWLAEGGFAASSHWVDDNDRSVPLEGRGAHWEGRRTSFPVTVERGQTVTLQLVVEAPRRAGLWRLQWDLVEEGVCWFSDRMPEPPPSLQVLVVPDPLGHGSWWSVLVLAAAAAAVSVWRHGGPATMVSFFAVGELVWLVGSVSVKQGVVLAGAGTAPTAFGWLLIVAGISIVALLTCVLPVRVRGWVCWLVAAGATLVLWADAIYLRFFGDLPSFAAFSGIGQLGQVEASLRELVRLEDAWLWIDLLPAVALVLVADRLRPRVGTGPRTVAMAALVLMAVAGGFACARLVQTQPSLLGQVFRRVVVAEEVGVLNLHLVDGAKGIARQFFDPRLDEEQFEEIISWFRESAPQRAGVGPAFAVAAGANLVMVQVESLQTFVIGLEIGGEEVTPFLNRWAEEGLWFSNVTDQTGQGRSSDSELATQVSLLPMAGGAAAFRYAHNQFTGLAQALGELGYDTLSAVPFDGAFWNRRQTHPAFGYARSLFVEDFETGESVGWGLSDRHFLAQALAKLIAAETPFAAYLLTLSLHHPFGGFPPQLEELDVGSWTGTPFGNYLHTMRFFDSSLAAFVSGLEREGLGENTVIAVWGDHDAGFAWRPEIAVAMGSSHDPVGWYLSQEVPLLIRVPGVDWSQAELTVAAGHADVAPTLLAVLGIDPAPYAFVGRNLLGDHGDRPVVGEYSCWRDSEHLFLQGDGSLDDGRCIELATMAPVPSADCREGHEEAQRIELMSSLVLDHDLQPAIHRELLVATGSKQ
jgi:phosphoglycerol transferase MdoB-like AlkP superfamily enzyme